MGDLHALFVHGMGRTPMSGWRMLAKLQAHGIVTHTFGYATSIQGFDSIRNRLVTTISALATRGDYVLIGHSLGGVMIRAALATLPTNTRLPRRVFLLGSPILSARLARTLQRNWIYRILTGDSGQLLADPTRMARIGTSPVPVTSILGVTGWTGRLSPFQGEMNDGLVSVSEARADWIDEEIRIPVIHTWLPSSSQVARIILERTNLGPGITT